MNDETKFLVVSPLHNDQHEMNNIDEFIIQKYQNDYVATTEDNNVLFKYSEESKQELKNKIDTPALTNIAFLSISDYKYDDSTAEWVEIDSSDPIFEHGQDLEKQNLDHQDKQQEDQQELHISNQFEEDNNEDDIEEYDGIGDIGDNEDNISNYNEFESNPSSDLSHEQNNFGDQIDYDNNQDEDIDYTIYNNEQSQDQSQLASKIDNQSQDTYDKRLESEDVLKDLVKELLPDSREIIDRINTNLNVQDSFDNPMSTIVRIIHNSTLQQLYSRVEDKVYELNDSRVDDSIDEYRNKVINHPPQILQDLKDEETQFREVSKNISSEVNKIQSNYDRELENYVREVGERARIEAEEQAKNEYIAQNEQYTQNQINEYVDSMSDTYNSLEASLSEMKDRVARSLINEFIYESHNPALSAALRFIKDKQDLEKRAQNDIDAINQSTQNAQLMNQQNYDDELLDPDTLEMSDDEFDQDDYDFDNNEPENYEFDDDEFNQNDDDHDHEELDDEESQEDSDDMSDDSIAESINQFSDEDSNEESDLNTDEFGLDENLNEQDDDSDKESDEQSDEDANDDSELNEDEESEEDNEKKLDKNLDEGGAAEEDKPESDEELNEFNDDEINILTPESDSEDEDEHQDSPEVDNEDDNKKLTHMPKSKFRESIEGNPYDNEDEDDDDEVDELRDDFNDQNNQNDESIKDDIIEDQNDVDTGKDLDEISQDNDDNKNKKSKKSKIIMGIIIALVVAIVIAFAALFLVNELSDDNSQQDQKQEQQAKKDHDQYLKDLKTYMLGSTQTVQMGDQTIKVKIVQINKDGSVEAEYKEKNKDDEVVKKRKTIEKPIIESALKKQKKKANKKENQTIDDSK